MLIEVPDFVDPVPVEVVVLAVEEEDVPKDGLDEVPEAPC